MQNEKRDGNGDGARQRDICERTFEFAVRIVALCTLLDVKPGTGRTLGKQLLRCGTSIGANMEEAQAGQSRPDFISKTSIALKEARETAYWLRLVARSGLIPEERIFPLRQEAEELKKILAAIVVSAKRLQQ